MIMERTAVAAHVTPHLRGTISTGSLARPPRSGSSTIREVRDVEAILDRVLEVLAEYGAEQEVPEVFDLQPLERRRVTLHARRNRERGLQSASFIHLYANTRDAGKSPRSQVDSPAG